MRAFLTASIIIGLFVTCAGCTCTRGTTVKSAYSVDNICILSVTCSPVPPSEEVLVSNETYTRSRNVMHTQSGDVVTYLAAPKNPKAVIVYTTGAGDMITGHEERMGRYVAAGYAFVFVDPRGNGAETPGTLFSQQLFQQDFGRFEKGDWPQYYLTICDLVSAKEIISDRSSVQVYAMGSSNGGRYAAVAAGVDPQFAGYVGITTSNWRLLDSVMQQEYKGDPVMFATSIEPGTYLLKISPIPVWFFHAAGGPVIPFSSGKQFFDSAHEPKTFTEFSGEHSINSNVDAQLIMHWAQIYGPRESISIISKEV